MQQRSARSGKETRSLRLVQQNSLKIALVLIHAARCELEQRMGFELLVGINLFLAV